jgi:hypothetical protein
VEQPPYCDLRLGIPAPLDTHPPRDRGSTGRGTRHARRIRPSVRPGAPEVSEHRAIAEGTPRSSPNLTTSPLVGRGCSCRSARANARSHALALPC